MTAEKKRLIDNFLDYVELMVRRNTARLTKLGVQKLITLQQLKRNFTEDVDDSPMADFNNEENDTAIKEEK